MAEAEDVVQNVVPGDNVDEEGRKFKNLNLFS
jgi:hypothetical protein